MKLFPFNFEEVPYYSAILLSNSLAILVGVVIVLDS